MRNVKKGHVRPIVCLDAGHYGKYNRSPVVPAYYESEMNWKLAHLLDAELARYGIEVWHTRKDASKDMALEDRGKASSGADLFLSLHSNAAGDESAKYVLGIYQVDDNCGEMDEQSKAFAGILAKTVGNVMGLPYKTWTSTSSQDRDGNGYKDDYYGVLRGAHTVHTPGVIIEHGFHTNTATAKWLLEESNLKKLAVAEVAAIAEWFDVNKSDAAQDSGILHRVQVGAFSNKAHAEAMLAEVKAAGFTDAFIVTEEKAVAVPETPKPVLKSVDEIAKEVIAGKWGSGADRKQRLTAAGYDYSAVQRRVNELMK